MFAEGCQRYREELSALRHGEEPGVPPEELRAHLEFCADCRCAREQAEVVSELLRSCQPPLPADGLDRLTAVVRALAAQSLGEAAPIRKRGTVVSLRVAVVAAAAVAAIALLVGYGVLGRRSDGAVGTAETAAVVTGVAGRAEIGAAHAAPAGPARAGMAVDVGCVLSTRTGGSLCLVTGRGARLELGGDSALEILGADSVRLVRGRLVAAVEKGANPFRVRTADAEVITLGTRFSVEADVPGTRVTVIEGRVGFSSLKARDGSRGRVEVSAGQSSLVLGRAVPSRPDTASPGDLGQLLPAPVPGLEVVFRLDRSELASGANLSGHAELVNRSGEAIELENVARAMPVLFVRLGDPAGRSSFACPIVTGATVDGRPVERAKVLLDPGSAYRLDLDLGAPLEAPGEHRLAVIYFGTIRSGTGTWSGSLESRVTTVQIKALGRPKSAGQAEERTNPAPLGGDSGRTPDGTR